MGKIVGAVGWLLRGGYMFAVPSPPSAPDTQLYAAASIAQPGRGVGSTYTAAMSVRVLLVAAFAAAAVTACARAPAHELRVQLTLVRPSADGTQIARHAADVARVPVRYVAPTTEQLHAVVLECADASQCEEALSRLRADTLSYERVDIDARRRIHSP